MKYLFCTDGSDNSFLALEAVLRLVKEGAVVDVFSVLISKNDLTKRNNSDGGDEYLKKISEKTKKIVKRHAQFLENIFVEHGDVQRIIEYLGVNFYNMIILGSHNYKGFKNKFFGFARKIVEKSAYPIFIFHGELSKLEKKKKKILLCVDDSFATLNAVISFMKNFNTDHDIVLLTVESQLSRQPLEICLEGNQLQEFAEKEIALLARNMDGIEKILCHNEINIKSKVHLRGNPSEEILNFAKQDFDLIVLGSHSKDGLVNFLFGSVSRNILDYVNIPVLIIPTKPS